MKLVTWNIQCGKGCDGVVDLARIVSDANALGDADVFCFQEVSANFANLDGGTDQSAVLSTLLPGYRPVFYPAVETVDLQGQQHRFGNMTLSRLPVLQVANHLLPWPRNKAVRSMRRHALETTVLTAFGPVRITNTHLEFHSSEQRDAQITRLLELQHEASSQPATATDVHREPYRSQTTAASAILCGDFNFDVSDRQHAMLQGSSFSQLNYRDAWMIAQPDHPRAPTCGIYDRAQWPHGADCRDFIFVTEDLAPRVRTAVVDQETAASDHQPVLIELSD